MIRYLKETLRLYAQRPLWTVLLLGFSSGLPLALTLGTLSLWMAEQGVSKTSIGLFALVGVPYTFKFAWAPLMDTLQLPWFSRRFGRRRGWALFTQLGVALTLLLLGQCDPVGTPWLTAGVALLVAFMSASQDIVLDAYRVELLTPAQQGAGAAMIVLGYRLGMLVSGAGALYLASVVAWGLVYAIMALCMGVGMLTVLSNAEPRAESVTPTHQGGLLVWLKTAVVAPFTDFMQRPGWLWVLLFILLYKLGDALAGVMSNPFYLDLAFTKIEIANITKLFGLVASILGGLVGGVLVARLGVMRALLLCGVLQMLSNLLFVVQAQVGHSVPLLGVTIGVENLAGGMGTAAFVAYLSGLCHRTYTATQYALLSSLAAVGRTLLAANAGWMAQNSSWSLFYGLTTLAALPGVLMIPWMMRRFPLPKTMKNG